VFDVFDSVLSGMFNNFPGDPLGVGGGGDGMPGGFGDPATMFGGMGPGTNAGRPGGGRGLAFVPFFAQLFQAAGSGGGGGENTSYEDWLTFIDGQMGGVSHRGATAQEIDSLPTGTFARGSRGGGSGGAGGGTAGSSSSPAATREDEERCAICLDPFEGDTIVKRLPCTHVFCDSCISQWLAINKECPCCKTSIRDPPRQA
jgi:hypothetical protein